MTKIGEETGTIADVFGKGAFSGVHHPQVGGPALESAAVVGGQYRAGDLLHLAHGR